MQYRKSRERLVRADQFTGDNADVAIVRQRQLLHPTQVAAYWKNIGKGDHEEGKRTGRLCQCRQNIRRLFNEYIRGKKYYFAHIIKSWFVALQDNDYFQ